MSIIAFLHNSDGSPQIDWNPRFHRNEEATVEIHTCPCREGNIIEIAHTYGRTTSYTVLARDAHSAILIQTPPPTTVIGALLTKHLAPMTDEEQMQYDDDLAYLEDAQDEDDRDERIRQANLRTML